MNKIFLFNVKDTLPLEDESVDCCVTSPPYFGLRDYGNEDQIGLEETPEEYVQILVEVFKEVKRVLKPEGTLWLNLGDSYAGSGKAKGDNSLSNYKQGTNRASTQQGDIPSFFQNDFYKPKDLIGIPWMVAFALRADGWYLRQDIIWHKPNPMPESVTDRCTKSHEYIFLLSKSKNYFYDYEAIKQPISSATVARMSQDIESQNGSDRAVGKTNGKMKAVLAGSWKGSSFDSGKTSVATNNGRKSGNKERKQGSERGCPEGTGSNVCGSVPWEGEKANKRSVWTVSTKPFSEAHFATFPQDLIVDCIKAGCPEGGLVLDPFMGAGTTALVARKLNRNYIGLELNPEYIRIAENRLYNELGMFV